MDLDKFAELARAKEWIEEPTGFSMDVDVAVYESTAFKLMSDPAPLRDPMLFQLEWLGQGDALADIDADFFRMYGKVAEDAQFISRWTDGEAVLYEVTVGADRHGHRATFRIVGARAASVVARYEQIVRDDLRKQPPRG